MTERGTSENGVFDRGLQPERTALAWRRTGLSLGGGSLLLARVLAETSIVLALVIGSVGLAASILTLSLVERRYRSHHSRLLAAGDERIPLAGGGLPFLVAVTVVLLGLGAILAVVLVAR